MCTTARWSAKWGEREIQEMRVCSHDECMFSLYHVQVLYTSTVYAYYICVLTIHMFILCIRTMYIQCAYYVYSTLTCESKTWLPAQCLPQNTSNTHNTSLYPFLHLNPTNHLLQNNLLCAVYDFRVLFGLADQCDQPVCFWLDYWCVLPFCLHHLAYII